MALSGKTTNFELKYPAVSDNIVMGPEATDNDFKEMMESVDSALNNLNFPTYDTFQAASNAQFLGFCFVKSAATDGPFKTSVNWLVLNTHSPIPTQYAFSPEGDTNGNAQKSAKNSNIYYRARNFANTSAWSDWKQFIRNDDVVDNLTSDETEMPLSAAQGKALATMIGTLSGLKTNKKDNLVNAINEVKDNISDNGIIDLGLVEGDLQQDDGAILLDVTGQGIYKYRVASGGEEEEEYLINAYNMSVRATTQFRFTYNSMYIRLLDDSTNNGQSVPWIKFTTDDIIGNLIDLTTTTKTNLVSAINEIINNNSIKVINGDTSHPRDSILLNTITGTGVYIYQISGGATQSALLFVVFYDSNPSFADQLLIDYDCALYKRRITLNDGDWDNPIVGQWKLINGYYNESTGDVTIGGKVNTIGTRDAGNVVIGSGATTVGDNGVVIGSAAEVTGANNKNAVAIGYEAVSAANGAIQIGQGTNSTANTTQIGNYPLLDATGKIVGDRLPDSASGIIDLGLVEGDLTEELGGIASSFLDVTTAGIYKFSIKNNGNETVDGYLIVSNNRNVSEINQYLFVGGGLSFRRLPDPDTSSLSTPVEWVNFATTDQIPTINGDTIITEYHITADPLTDSRQLSTYFDNAGVYYFTFTNDTSISGYLFTHRDNTDQIVYQTMIYKNGVYTRSFSSGSFNDETWTVLGGKKYSSIVIGNSGSGHKADDVDYLYEEGTDFGTVLISAISKLTGSGAKGGEIKILSGTYTLTSAVTTSGTSTAPIKITGEGKSTIITSDNPTSYYINAKYCEISEYRLETDIQIITDGYVNIHDCEIAERIHFNNSATLQDIFIHDNNLDYTTSGKNFLYLSGAGGIYNFQVYNNYCYGTNSFNFLNTAATKNIYGSSIRNNHCPYGTWSSSTYDLNSGGAYYVSTMTGNIFYTINFSGSYWCISNNSIAHNLYLYDGDNLSVMNNKVGTFTVASGLTYADIVGNVITNIDTSSPYVNLGIYSRFVNNVIRNTSFNTTYIPGYDTASNKWGNNMWANGIDRLVFANEEEIGAIINTYGSGSGTHEP